MTARSGLVTVIAWYWKPIFWTLVGLGVALRVLLAVDCPTPFGYVFDYYHEAVQIFYDTGRLPVAGDCWQCYHPPLFYLLGLPFYAAGVRLFSASEDPALWGLRGLTLVAVLCGGVTAYYSYRLVRYLVRDPVLVTIGTALILTFPCLFISSYGPDADIVVAAAMTAFLFYLVRFNVRLQHAGWRDAAVLGMLAGLAAAAKYSGLIALATAGVVLGVRLLTTRGSHHIVRLGLIVLGVAIVAGSARYIDNVRRYGTPLFANGSAADAFSAHREYYWEQYDFLSFHPLEAIAVSAPGAPPGQLTTLPVYRSVWTTLYGMAWGDLSFFSVRGRIDDPAAPYPTKQIPVWLTGAVIFLGLTPTALAFIGFALTWKRREYLPLLVMLALTLTSYFAWVVAQDEWALKTKYLLFLLPVYVTYTCVGLRWTLARLPGWLADLVLLLLVTLIGVAHLYLFAFARGRLL